MTAPIQKLGFYTTPPHTCNYFYDRQAVTLFADPRFPKSPELYSALAHHGFRRSGKHLYQPHCGSCKACIPVRVAVHKFHMKRNQQRTWRRNQDLDICILPPEYKSEHFELYARYLSVRHPNGGMDDPEPENYQDFLIANWSDTIFYEMRLAGQLLAVAVVDRLIDGLSAVYTFFDPDYTTRGLGTYAILFEIEQAKQLNLQWLYLGYWIEECAKMNYKNRFQPLEYYLEGQWQQK